jgi:hypothetical protein
MLGNRYHPKRLAPSKMVALAIVIHAATGAIIKAAVLQ